MVARAEQIKTSLRGSTTESAANTFTESPIDTNLAIRGDHIFVMTGLWLFCDIDLNASGEAYTIQLCYAPQTAIVAPSDPDWLAGIKWVQSVVTSGGGVHVPLLRQPIEHFPIATAQLFLGVQGTGQAGAKAGHAKIEGYHQKVSTTEYFRLAQSR